MAAARFYENCREQGMKLTPEEAAEMREDWIKAFTEMGQHMQATPIRETTSTMRFFGMDDDEDDEDEEENSDGKPKQLYRAVLVNGMVRNRCTYCSALNIQFQGLAAYGMKMAMWNMAMAGYLPRMVNMIH